MAPQIITAPSAEKPWFRTRCFLAGGITDCPEWQDELLTLLDGETGLTIYNPRQANFDVRNPDAADAQIEWEHDRLCEANLVSFWFPSETLCPITLYELGKLTERGTPLVVGCHPNYKRLTDVVKQTELDRPEVKVVFTLREVAVGIVEYAVGRKSLETPIEKACRLLGV
jgi:hypothetical protein